MNLEDAVDKAGSANRQHAHDRPAERLGWTIVGSASSAMILLTAIASVVTLVSAKSPSADIEIDNALAGTTDKLLKNSGCPRDAESIQAAAANLFVILNPELAHRERRKEPSFLKAESTAAASFFNPGAVHSKRMEDVEYRRNYHAAMEAFHGAVRKAEAPVMPSATDAKQIEALRNNPAWRREREAPVQALMPAVVPP